MGKLTKPGLSWQWLSSTVSARIAVKRGAGGSAADRSRASGRPLPDVRSYHPVSTYHGFRFRTTQKRGASLRSPQLSAILKWLPRLRGPRRPLLHAAQVAVHHSFGHHVVFVGFTLLFSSRRCSNKRQEQREAW